MHPFYTAWHNMKLRCSPDFKQAKDYYERGISYDPSWESYDNFYADMRATWKRGLTLDRKDNNESYCKNNCQWVTRKEQQQNSRVSKLTQEAADSIRKLWESGEYTYKDLCKKYTVKEHIIADILRGKNYV